MKSTRLTPTPRNPTTAASADTPADGNATPRKRASAAFTVPATNPFIMAIKSGSEEESLRVRLLSIPHARHAPATRTAPEFSRTPCPSHDRTTAPARIARAPRRSRRSTFSRNTSHAMLMVARPSRFKRSAADIAFVRTSPSMRSSGPIMPPKRTTAANHGTSVERSGASGAGKSTAARPRRMIASPMPAPR